jgi:hypothetical protein
VRIFGSKSQNPLNPSHHQIQDFHHELEQLIDRGARGKLKEALEDTLGTVAPLGEDLITVEACPSHTIIVGPLWTNLATASE